MDLEMEMVIRGLVALVCLFTFGLGIMSMFAPSVMVKNFSLEPDGIAGLSAIRSVMGGLFLSSLSMLLLGLTTNETIWFLAVAIIMGVVALGRMVGIVFDGFTGKILPPLIVELAIVAVLTSAHLQLSG